MEEKDIKHLRMLFWAFGTQIELLKATLVNIQEIAESHSHLLTFCTQTTIDTTIHLDRLVRTLQDVILEWED